MSDNQVLAIDLAKRSFQACATSHYWGRVTQGLGHNVWPVPPIYMKPSVEWQKSDAADAAAIAEVAPRPSMHCIAAKSAERQARVVALFTHIFERPALRRLAGPDAQGTLNGWQDAARRRQQDGPQHPGDDDQRAELQDGVSGTSLSEVRAAKVSGPSGLGREID